MRSIAAARQHLSLAYVIDRILVLSNGKLQEQGSPAELDGTGSLMSLLVAAE